MVAINKRPVRLLCSPNPLRESHSLFLLRPPPPPFFFLHKPLSFFLLHHLLSPPLAPEFPAVVILEPCEPVAGGSISPVRKKEKSRSPFSFFASTSRRHPTPSSDRACQRHCRIQEGERGWTVEEGIYIYIYIYIYIERERERERERMDCARSTKSILKSDIFQVG